MVYDFARAKPRLVCLVGLLAALCCGCAKTNHDEVDTQGATSNSDATPGANRGANRGAKTGAKPAKVTFFVKEMGERLHLL